MGGVGQKKAEERRKARENQPATVATSSADTSEQDKEGMNKQDDKSVWDDKFANKTEKRAIADYIGNIKENSLSSFFEVMYTFCHGDGKAQRTSRFSNNRSTQTTFATMCMKTSTTPAQYFWKIVNKNTGKTVFGPVEMPPTKTKRANGNTDPTGDEVYDHMKKTASEF